MHNKSGCLSRTWKSQIGAVHVSEMAIPFFTSLSLRQLVNYKKKLAFQIFALLRVEENWFFLVPYSTFASVQIEKYKTRTNWFKQNSKENVNSRHINLVSRIYLQRKVSKVQHFVLTHTQSAQLESCKLLWILPFETRDSKRDSCAIHI